MTATSTAPTSENYIICIHTKYVQVCSSRPHPYTVVKPINMSSHFKRYIIYVRTHCTLYSQRHIYALTFLREPVGALPSQNDKCRVRIENNY